MSGERRYWVQVSAGTGPSEVRRFVGRLSARLEAMCEARALVVEEVLVHGDPDAPASVELLVAGEASTELASELGTHALVARSASRGKQARKRWFAGVSLHPHDEPAGAVTTLRPDELEVRAIRASGPGGQHVNKASTAVRVTHLPSGLSVRVSDERSQRSNLARAVERLARRLMEADRDLRAAGEATRRRSHYSFERGAPVRTYREGPDGILVG